MEPGILKLTEQEHGEVEAHAVKLRVAVEGENFVYGNAALEKSEEVKTAVEQLKTVEPQIGIYVESVRVKSESGWFTRSSTGVYCLLIVLDELAKINEVLGVVLGMKNVSLTSLDWVFNEDETKLELAKKAMIKAKAKAEAMTGVIGYRVTGIRSCSDSYEVPNVNLTIRSPDAYDHLDGLMMAKRKGSAPTPVANIGTEMKGKREITAMVSVEFTIAGDRVQQSDAH